MGFKHDMNINNTNLSFKSVIINNGGLDFVVQNDGKKAVQMLTEAQIKYRKSSWRLIVGDDGYQLYSPKTSNTYAGPFNVKKHRKTDKNNNVQEQLIIRTGENNRIKFIIDYPTRDAVVNIYKKIKNSAGLSKMLLLFEVLEQQNLLQKTNKRLRQTLNKIV